ncbi:three-helix bundle dimerization domain-containing protein [Candidatus Mycolicibacterium alkanivorans]|uniref:Uncharacterized protein n=1 Tax=Candidatus Mycolicibacterium alkanivorans TaxID=2954114 RepID=A0ABS9YYZ0_9MYCO|nr:hypothetical protein [Candidatus Mycolicibacterium alkanivorans]MCI4675994.1 hypothetical protein [Candidatus Mycolicibacterium alkanivorans]
MAQISEAMMIDQVLERLSSTFSDIPPQDVTEVVRTAHARFDSSTVREFVPLLVERRARAELSAKSSLLTWSS